MLGGVIFDMDGVITDNNAYHEMAWTEFCARYGITLTREEVHHQIYGRVAKDTLEFVFKKKLTNEEIAGYLDEKETIYRAVYRNFIEPLPGLLKLLDSLKRSNIKIGLATSAPPGNVDFTFSFIPVRSYFEVILDGNSITRGKPDPEVYSRTIGMLGLKPAECVIFEDSLPGIKAGLASGAHVVGVATTHNMDELREVSRVITDFSEVDIPFLHQVIGLP